MNKKDIIKSLTQYWDEVINGEKLNTSEAIASVFHKWTRTAKKKKAKRQRIAHRGTNWNAKKPKEGFIRIKTPAGTYVYKKMTGQQKASKRRLGKRLGKQQKRFRS